MAEQSMNGSETQVSPAKKIKIEVEGTSENDKSIHKTADMNLSAFEMKRILQTNCMRKTICVEGTFKGHESPAIVLLEKKIFPVEELFLKRGFFNEGTILRRLFTNDIYGNYECFPTREYNGLNVTVIHPATEKHIQKFMRKELYIVDETKEIYQNVTLPHIESKNFSLTWVDNILQHKAEQENVLFEDPDKEKGFMLVSDLKWDGDKNTLKLIALPFVRIKSIRELRASHLPLLKNIRDASSKLIKEKFDIHSSQLRIYLHYQPSYYHLHVHISYLMFETPGIYVEKAHLLSTIINNIELDSEYYSKATLSFIVQQNDELFDKLKEHGVFGDLEIKPLEV